MKVIGYARVSSAQQAATGAGMAAQRDAIKGEAARRGWTIVAFYEDRGVSGRSVEGRVGLADALRAVEAREADALVAAKVDRLSRSLMDFAALIERSRTRGWALIALDAGVDTSSPSGEMLANVLAVFSQFERRLIGQRTREALAARRAQGVRLGRPRSVPVGVRAAIVEARRQGGSYRAIARQLNETAVPTAHGGRAWHPETIRKVVCSETLSADVVR